MYYIDIHAWDWNTVALICPEYKQYLDVRTSTSVERREGVDLTITQFRGKQSEYNDAELSILGACAAPVAQEVTEKILTQDDLRFYFRIYKPKDEYVNVKYPAPDPNILLLPPPLRVIKSGTVWKSDSISYEVVPGKCTFYTTATRSRLVERDGKLRLMRGEYYFNREKDLLTQRPKYSCMIYDLEKGRMYMVEKVSETKQTKNGVASRKKSYQYKIRQAGWSSESFAGVSLSNHRLLSGFVKRVEEVVKSKISEPILPNNVPQVASKFAVMLALDNALREKDNLYALLAQHKVGKRIGWLDNTTFTENLKSLKSLHAYMKRKNNKIKKMLDKILKTLKKDPSPKNLLSHIYGAHYKNIYNKLWRMDTNAYRMIDIIIQYSDMPHADPDFLEMYHYNLSVIINKHPEYIDCMKSIMLQLTNTIKDGQPQIVAEASRYISFINKIGYPLPLINYNTYKDTMSMANALNIHIRLHHINTPEKLDDVHDKLTAIQNRNFRVRTDFADKGFFYPFALPDKEYDGFRFVQLMTPSELIAEGTLMRHCVGGYSHSCFSGHSIIVSMIKERSWATIELLGGTYVISQKYTICDNTINKGSKISQLIDKWHKDVLEMHKDDRSTYMQDASDVYERKLEELRKSTEESTRKQLQKDFGYVPLWQQVNAEA